jgi:hypothetical protein
MRVIVFDNEAVQALRDAGHHKHRQVLAHLAGIIQRRRRGLDVSAAVPTAVRVEAGWDRTHPAAAPINRLRVVDHVLDRSSANVAAAIISNLTGVSVADAHIGAAVRSLPHEEVVVLTSDPADIERVAGHQPVRTVRV